MVVMHASAHSICTCMFDKQHVVSCKKLGRRCGQHTHGIFLKCVFVFVCMRLKE